MVPSKTFKQTLNRMLKIVADEDIPYLRGVLEPYALIEYKCGELISRKDVEDADALIIRTRTRCGNELLDGTKIRYIATATIGTDHIDKAYCAGKGIEVYNAAGCNAAGVLQWVSAVTACLNRSRGLTPDKTTIGVIGVGNVGSLVSRCFRNWGFEVLLSDPPRELREGLTSEEGFYGLSEIGERAGLITFHVPLTRGGEFPTYGMADGSFISRLKPGCVVLNSSRGGVIDEDALADAAGSGHIAACVDTWHREPDINRKLLAVADMATPHVAGYTMQGKANATSMVVRDLARRFGLPLCGWYPGHVGHVDRQDIGWEQMLRNITRYYDIEAETSRLRGSPEEFESMRRSYIYREEFF